MRAAEPIVSVDEFLEQRFDLPESGQWSELVEGRLVHRQPPDLDHGNTVLNLSKILAEYALRSEGYACFDLGLLLERDPDTVWFPAVSYFDAGPRFAEIDKAVSERVPAAVIELASTADRRGPLASRVQRYLDWGVRSVWSIDPGAKTVEQFSARQIGEPVCWTSGEVVTSSDGLTGLEVSVDALFAEPAWWSSG